MKRKKGYYSISAVAKIFSVHQQTIRLYEKEGLISPKRSEGNTRLFSEDDINRLEEIIYLTHKLGINLAGVNMILRLKKQMKKMQKEMNKVFKNAQNELDQESKTRTQELKDTVLQLTQLKQSNKDFDEDPEEQSNKSSSAQEPQLLEIIKPDLEE